MHILIACRAIDNMAGGVERQALALCNEMIKRGHQVSLLTLDQAGAKAFYPLDQNVTWHQLNMGNAKHAASWSLRLKRMKKIRDIMAADKPDVILAFQQGMFLTLRLYLAGLGIPVIGAERESPYRFDHTSDGKHKNLIFQTFRLAPAITVQCASYINAYPKYLRHKIHVIPNPVFPAPASGKKIAQKSDQKILLCVGRLSYQKNQTALLKAFANLKDETKDWKLLLAGEGEDRAKLETLIHDLELTNKVEMPGAIQNVSALYHSADLLCIPSRWEGFPNVLGESLSHGLPAIGYENCGGVCDLINDGENGLLATGNGDIGSLTQTLKTAITNDDLRAKLQSKTVQSIQDYAPERIYNLWEYTLKKLANT